jgi:uncharacterized protein with GYD domain
MAHYLVQGNYSPASVKAMLDHPQDRTGPVGALIESAGGKLKSLYFALGESDVYVLFELPDHVSAAAVGLAVANAGSMSSYKTTALLTPDEAMKAMKKAKTLSYARPG